MDIPHPSQPGNVYAYHHRRRWGSVEPRRDTILISIKPISEEERKRWYGAAPAPVPETDRLWRPNSFKF